MMSDNAQSYPEWQGNIVPKTLHAGYIVLSYVVSWIGAWTTLELFNRRTARRGLYNWRLLTASSVSMGGIAIWGMHYIGNRAILLANGDDALQIAYNPGFTIVSFLVPIAVLLAAFITVGSNEQISFVRVSLGGGLAGLSICGMHYLGQAGISNYRCEYSVPYVVGSGVIAVAATISALTIFFTLRAIWTNSWYKRGMTAIILAGAVSGMHWQAEAGTQYRLRPNASLIANPSRNSIVVVVIVLSISASFILLGFTILAQRTRFRSANRAQHVILAVAIFDNDGRLMVTPEGLLPNEKITRSYIKHSFDDVFGVSHPVFSWIFRTSRNWTAISGMLPAMKTHINQTFLIGRSQVWSSDADISVAKDDGQPIKDYSIMFRELFCIAASNLAEQLDEPLENAGILYDEIFSTGHKTKTKQRSRKTTSTTSADIEQDGEEMQSLGRGQLLFLTRHVDRKEAERLQNAGFRFAGIQNVGDILARSMQISCDSFAQRLLTMRDYTSRSHILEPGLHLACFAIRASMRGGFDVLVRKSARNQLPAMQIPLNILDSSHLEYLRQLDGLSVAQCIKSLGRKKTTPFLTAKEQTFTAQLYDTLEALRDEIEDPFFNDAVLKSEPVPVPCRGSDDDARPSRAQLIVFHTLVPIHARAPSEKLEFLPLSSFKMQQHVYKNSPDHGIFARKIHREFGPILNQTRISTDEIHKINSSTPTFYRLRFPSRVKLSSRPGLGYGGLIQPESPDRSRSLKFWQRRYQSRTASIQSLSERKSVQMLENSYASSEKNLVEAQTFGGIMVSQEVSVDVRDLSSEGTPVLGEGNAGFEIAHLQASPMGTLGTASKEIDDPETFVDRLFTICVETR